MLLKIPLTKKAELQQVVSMREAEPTTPWHCSPPSGAVKNLNLTVLIYPNSESTAENARGARRTTIGAGLLRTFRAGRSRYSIFSHERLSCIGRQEPESSE